MKGLVVYQSKWGDCRQIAEAIARGLTGAGQDVDVEPVASVGSVDPQLDFIVVGGPTRAARAYGPINRLAKNKFKEGWAGKPFATFSTGASVYRGKPNTQASERIYKLLQANGMTPLAPPFKAGVQDMHGPLGEGEVERAEEFGKELGAKLSGGV
jgi:menaquinone-dependent protoporphyrinogen IX oxidase